MLPQRTAQEAAEQAPDATRLLKQGVAAFKAGQKEQARTLIAKAAELDPDSEVVWMWTASTARKRGEALAALDRVLALNPENAKAKQWLQWLSPARPQPAERPHNNGQPSTAAVPAKAATPISQTNGAATAAATAPIARESQQPSESAEVEEKSAARAPESKSSSKPTPIEQILAAARDRAAAQQAARETVEDDPIREMLAGKAHEEPADAAAEAPAAAAETGDQPAHDAPMTAAGEEISTASVETAEPVETVEEQDSTSPAVVSEPASRSPRPISQETCLLCGKRSLTEGVCGYCKAISDITQLDEISRNEQADRTVMLAAVDRFRKELETGPSFEANLGLALAYLHIQQSNDALPRLTQACRLQPDNVELRLQCDRLRSRRLILVVDDSKTVQKMIAGVLEKELYRVSLADDGLQALARLDGETPSLILLDITMPRMDGYQVARIISGNDATRAIPVVMLSGKDGFLDRVRGRLAGAKGYVTKPFDPAELTETIQSCLYG